MKIIILLFFILIFKNNLEAVEWRRLTPDNSPIKQKFVNYLFEDSNRNIWYCSNFEIVKINNNKNIVIDSNYRDDKNIQSFENIIEDIYGNIIFRSTSGLGILINGKWQIFSVNDNPKLGFKKTMFIKDSLLYLDAAGYNRAYALKYDIKNKIYVFSPENDIESINASNEYLGSFLVKFNDLIVYADNNVTKKTLNVLNLKDNFFTKDYLNLSLELQNVNFIKYFKNVESHLMMSTVNKDSSMSLFIFDKDFKFKRYNYKSKLVNPHLRQFTDFIKISESSYLIVNSAELLLLKNGDFSLISKPSLLGNDIDIEWTPFSLLYDGIEVYVGTLQGGLFITNLNELLLNTSIENEKITNTHLIFPNPSSEKVSLDLGGVAVADLVVYDILGNEIMSIPNYSNKSEIDISSLSIGTYTIQIQTITGSISQRLLVNR